MLRQHLTMGSRNLALVPVTKGRFLRRMMGGMNCHLSALSKSSLSRDTFGWGGHTVSTTDHSAASNAAAHWTCRPRQTCCTSLNNPPAKPAHCANDKRYRIIVQYLYIFHIYYFKETLTLLESKYIFGNNF